ncbi:MAG: hypothetical protein ACFB11_08515 [Paracoccaceae bacterium]|mgnify:CR=1 FL=1
MSNTDSFIDEVNEEVRRDRVYALVRKYGWIAVLLILLIVGGAAFNEYRQAQDRAQAEALGDAMLAALETDDPAARADALSAVTAETPEGEAVLAFLTAGEQAGSNPEAAAQALESIVASSELPQIYRQLASFKALTLSSGLRTVEERRAGFEDLAAPGNPMRTLAEEQLALIDIEEGQKRAAIERLQSLIADAEATADLQQRALQVIVALGGEPDLSGLVPRSN